MSIKRLLAVSGLVCLISCVHSSRQAEMTPARTPSYDPESYNPYFDVQPDYSPSSEDLTFSELEQILDTKKFSRMEDLLMHLKEVKPAYMKRFALAFKSKSLHEASKSHPRAIVYGARGNFVLTFNGDSKQTGYPLLEVTEFNHKRKEFEYREIEFNEFGQLDGPYIISEVDGPKMDGQGKCLQCHSNRRPIWERYDVWPGFYGAYDDYPFNPNPKGGEKTRFGINHPASVKEEWARFLNDYGKKGRYASLDLTKGPRNTAMSLHMTFLNTLRIAELIRKAGGRHFRHAVLYTVDCFTLLREQNDGRLLPDAKILSLTKSIEQNGRKKILHYEGERLDQLVESVGLTFNQVKLRFEEQKLVPVGLKSRLDFFKAYLEQNGLDGPADVNIDDFLPIVALSEAYLPQSKPETWSMALFEGIHGYNGGNSFISFRNLRYQLRDALFTPEEQKDLFPIEVGGQKLTEKKIQYCRDLAEKMKDTL